MGEFSLASGTGFLGVSYEEIAMVNGEAKGFKLDDDWLLWGDSSDVDICSLGKLAFPVNVTLVGASTLRVEADVTFEPVLGAGKRSLDLGTWRMESIFDWR